MQQMQHEQHLFYKMDLPVALPSPVGPSRGIPQGPLRGPRGMTMRGRQGYIPPPVKPITIRSLITLRQRAFKNDHSDAAVTGLPHRLGSLLSIRRPIRLINGNCGPVVRLIA